MPPRILEKIRAKIRGSGDKNLTRIRRRRALADLAWRMHPRLQYVTLAFMLSLAAYRAAIRLLLFAVGYLWMLTIPSVLHGQRTYIDENALQPGQVRECTVHRRHMLLNCSQVNTYWNWADVHRADRYLEQLESLRDRNASSRE